MEWDGDTIMMTIICRFTVQYNMYQNSSQMCVYVGIEWYRKKQQADCKISIEMQKA